MILAYNKSVITQSKMLWILYSRMSSRANKVETDVDTSVVCFYQVSLNLQLLLQVDFKLIVNVLDYRLKAEQIIEI